MIGIASILRVVTSPVAKYAAGFLAIWLVASWIISGIEDRALQRDRIQELEADLKLERETASALESAAEAANQLTIDAQREVDRLRRIQTEVQNAPDSENGPVSPLLRFTIDSLYGVEN